VKRGTRHATSRNFQGSGTWPAASTGSALATRTGPGPTGVRHVYRGRVGRPWPHNSLGLTNNRAACVCCLRAAETTDDRKSAPTKGALCAPSQCPLERNQQQEQVGTISRVRPLSEQFFQKRSTGNRSRRSHLPPGWPSLWVSPRRPALIQSGSKCLMARS